MQLAPRGRRTEPGMQGWERQWPEIRHARELSSQAEGGGEQDGRTRGKGERQRMGRSHRAGMCMDQILWPQVLAEVTGSWHLSCTIARGAPITPRPHSLMPARLSSEQAATSPFHRRANRGSGRYSDYTPPLRRTQPEEDPGRGLPPPLPTPGVQALICNLLGFPFFEYWLARCVGVLKTNL